MREIKFRGLDGESETFVYGFYYENTGAPCILSNDYFNENIRKGTIGQFTGLKDKNGVEIYEGDIVTAKQYPFYDGALDGIFKKDDLNYVAEVYFCDENSGYYFEYHKVSDRVSGNVIDSTICDIDSSSIEVIGNIHKNPELLKEISK